MPEPNPSRVPPHNRQAEQAVLGAILLDKTGKTFKAVADVLTAEMFYVADYGAIFAACVSLAGRGSPTDFLLVQAELKRMGRRDLADDAGLLELTSTYVAASGATAAEAWYAADLMNAWRLRRTWEAAGRMEVEAMTPGADADAVVGAASKAIMELARTGPNRGARTVGEILEVVISDAVMGTLAAAPVIATGLIDLDTALDGGFRPGEFIIVAGRPSTGKSSLALQVYIKALLDGKAPFLFSLEVAEYQLGMNMLSQLSGVGLSKIRMQLIGAEERKALVDAVRRMTYATPKGVVSDRALQRPSGIRAQVERAISETGCQIVFIDYLQLMTGDESRSRNWSRLQEVSDISRAMKIMAKDLKIPVVALSQLNRNAAENVSDRPKLSQLRECGALEQDADTVILLHVDYGIDAKVLPTVELNIAKQRAGRGGPNVLAYTLFDGACLRFLTKDKNHKATVCAACGQTLPKEAQ